MSDAPVVNVDPAEFWADPYPTLARMRAETPICFVPELGATLLTRRDDIHTCEKNVAVFSSDQPGGLMNVLMGKNMMRSDGEEHRREEAVGEDADPVPDTAIGAASHQTRFEEEPRDKGSHDEMHAERLGEDGKREGNDHQRCEAGRPGFGRLT